MIPLLPTLSCCYQGLATAETVQVETQVIGRGSSLPCSERKLVPSMELPSQEFGTVAKHQREIERSVFQSFFF